MGKGPIVFRFGFDVALLFSLPLLAQTQSDVLD